MAITSLDELVAGFQPPQFFYEGYLATTRANTDSSFWAASGGIPGGTGTQDSNASTGTTLSSSSGLITGQLPWADPSAGLDTYLARLTTACMNANILLCDRLWQWTIPSLTSTSAQTVTSPTWPARDINGNTNGVGVYLAFEVYSALANTNEPVISVGYTNSSGTSGRSGTANISNIAFTSWPAGYFSVVGLQGADVGVGSVQSVTLASSLGASGSAQLVAYRPIAFLHEGMADLDSITGCLPQMFNGSVPFLAAVYVANPTVNLGCAGSLVYAQG